TRGDRGVACQRRDGGASRARLRAGGAPLPRGGLDAARAGRRAAAPAARAAQPRRGRTRPAGRTRSLGALAGAPSLGRDATRRQRAGARPTWDDGCGRAGIRRRRDTRHWGFDSGRDRHARRAVAHWPARSVLMDGCAACTAWGWRAALGLLLLAACGRNDTPTREDAVEPMVLGRENVAAVREQIVEVGPTISGSLEPREQAVIRAEAAG